MNLQKKRIEKGLSQRELAELANISKRTLEHYEAGQLIIENALLETLIKLSSVLDCRIEDIIDDENIRSTIRANGLALILSLRGRKLKRGCKKKDALPI